MSNPEGTEQPVTVRWPRSRRGGRAVECGGLENRYPSLGGSRVQIPPPPLPEPKPMRTMGSRAYAGRRETRGGARLGSSSLVQPRARPAYGVQGQTEPQVIPRGRKLEYGVSWVRSLPSVFILKRAFWSPFSMRSTIHCPSGE